jgi:addiction module HigA family antidote
MIKGLRMPKERILTPPGEMLLEEFLKPLRITQTELAERIRVPYVRVNEIVNGKRRITPSSALRLAKAFGTSPEFWLNGQLASDLYRTIKDEKEVGELEQIEPVPR